MILLLENKESRLPAEKFEDTLEIVKGDGWCDERLDAFMEDNTIFDTYSTVIIHESIYEEEKRDALFKVLKAYCKTKQKRLAIFSGNHTQASFSDGILRLSPSILYKHLKLYIKNKDLRILAYGENYSINLMLNTLEQINLYISNDTQQVLFDDFEDNVDLLKLKDVLTEDEYNQLFHSMQEYDNYIDTNQISILANNLKKLIQEKAND